MTPEKRFQALLGLGLNLEVVESRFEQASGTVFLEMRKTARRRAVPRREGGCFAATIPRC
jgi:hypothetical protein